MSGFVVVRHGPPRRPGSVAAKCARCGVASWAAKENAALLREGVPTICMQCAATMLARSPTTPQLALSPAAEAKLKKRKRRLARKLGVPVENIGHWPPMELGLALEAQKRRN